MLGGSLLKGVFHFPLNVCRCRRIRGRPTEAVDTATWLAIRVRAAPGLVAEAGPRDPLAWTRTPRVATQAEFLYRSGGMTGFQVRFHLN